MGSDWSSKLSTNSNPTAWKNVTCKISLLIINNVACIDILVKEICRLNILQDAKVFFHPS